ncbi:MAG: polysaccharide biosynthesis/export family protein [Pseudomonadota bacterium]
MFRFVRVGLDAFGKAAGVGRACAALIALAALAACVGAPPPPPTVVDENDPTRAGEYRLGAGDTVRLSVFGEPDLSGEFEIDGTGEISLPLIGELMAKDLTLRQLEEAYEAKLKQGYLTDPRASAEVLNFRPFYIIGEVQTGGEYPYQANMTILKAISLAGGFTYRADNRRVLIKREGSDREYQYNDLTAEVRPGDVIRVPERLF